MHKLFTLAFILSLSSELMAFCGFYVAKAGSELFNNRSEVIYVRDGNRSVITMSNDFSGNTSEFAMVVPVPTVLEKKDIKIGNQLLFDKLDAYSGPRLVEYYDHNPCEPMVVYEVAATSNRALKMRRNEDFMESDKEEYGVTIEASYTVGEYDILILSANESDGLKRWLTDNEYSIPSKAERVLDPYIKNGLKFFVVKVNTDKMKETGFNKLRPLQISFESERFMLPIRLGMANSNGAQDMIVYMFTKNGRVESANYRTVEMPSNNKIPNFIKPKFDQFYVDLFDKAYKKENKNSVFVEYAWNVTPSFGGMKCDPCVGPPPITQELRQAGVWWVNDRSGQSVFFTRLHVRYTEDKFPQDLQFISTPDRNNFQARYVMTHPATGNFDCESGKKYLRDLKNRRGLELRELQALTDWNVAKYTQYVDKGSGQIDEKKYSSPTPPVNHRNNNPGNTGITILLLGVLGFIVINFIADLKQIVFIHSKS